MTYFLPSEVANAGLCEQYSRLAVYLESSFGNLSVVEYSKSDYFSFMQMPMCVCGGGGGKESDTNRSLLTSWAWLSCFIVTFPD